MILKLPMLRVLLVLEDYGEMLFLQTLLKKMGFDVEGVQNPRMLSDSILSLNPEVVVMTAFGKRINGLELSQSIRRPRGLPQVLLTHPQGTPAGTSSHVQGWLVSPTSATDFLRKIAEVANLDLKQLEEKYQRLTAHHQNEEPHRAPRTAPGESVDLAKSRQEREAKALSEEPRPTTILFNRKRIEENVKELRRTEDPQRTMILENERRAFVLEMFKKKN